MTILAASLVVHALAQLPQVAPCPTDTPWTPSQIIWTTPFNERGPNPYAAAASATHTYIIAEHSVPVAGRDSLRDGLMIGITIPSNGATGARVIPTPPNHFAVTYPRIAVDRAGSLRMLWVEYKRAPEPNVERKLTTMTLWAGTYDNRRWRVELLATLHGLWWTLTGPSPLITDERGDLHLAAPTVQPEPQPYVLYLTLRDGHWRVVYVPHDGTTAYAAVATRHDSIFVGTIAAGPDSDTNSVWISISPDRGRTWTRPLLVSRSGDLGARELRVVPDPDGPIHVVWTQKSVPNEFLGSRVRIATSRDGGATWAAPADLKQTAAQVYILGVTPPSRHAFQTMYWADGAITLVQACGGVWGTPVALRDTLQGTATAALLDRPGKATQVIWGAAAFPDSVGRRLWMRSTIR